MADTVDQYMCVLSPGAFGYVVVERALYHMLKPRHSSLDTLSSLTALRIHMLQINVNTFNVKVCGG